MFKECMCVNLHYVNVCALFFSLQPFLKYNGDHKFITINVRFLTEDMIQLKQKFLGVQADFTVIWIFHITSKIHIIWVDFHAPICLLTRIFSVFIVNMKKNSAI